MNSHRETPAVVSDALVVSVASDALVVSVFSDAELR